MTLLLDDLQQPGDQGADGAEQGDKSEQVIKSFFPQCGFFAKGEFATTTTIGRRAGIALWRWNGVAERWSRSAETGPGTSSPLPATAWLVAHHQEMVTTGASVSGKAK